MRLRCPLGFLCVQGVCFTTPCISAFTNSTCILRTDKMLCITVHERLNALCQIKARQPVIRKSIFNLLFGIILILLPQIFHRPLLYLSHFFGSIQQVV